MTQSVTLEDGSVHTFPDDATPDEMNAALPAAPPPPTQVNAVDYDEAGNPIPYSYTPTPPRQMGLTESALVGGAIGATAALPNELVHGTDRVSQYIYNKLTGSNAPYTPDAMTQWADRNLPSQEQLQKNYNYNMNVTPTEATSPSGQVYQAVVSALPSLGLGAATKTVDLVKSALPVVGGAAAASMASQAYPDNPLAPPGCRCSRWRRGDAGPRRGSKHDPNRRKLCCTGNDGR